MVNFPWSWQKFPYLELLKPDYVDILESTLQRRRCFIGREI